MHTTNTNNPHFLCCISMNCAYFVICIASRFSQSTCCDWHYERLHLAGFNCYSNTKMEHATLSISSDPAKTQISLCWKAEPTQVVVRAECKASKNLCLGNKCERIRNNALIFVGWSMVACREYFILYCRYQPAKPLAYAIKRNANEQGNHFVFVFFIIKYYCSAIHRSSVGWSVYGIIVIEAKQTPCKRFIDEHYQQIVYILCYRKTNRMSNYYYYE